tara:strand:- start:30490 stop:31068 length:579 start_codon:yes stop_codon:yes gene_type:complete
MYNAVREAYAELVPPVLPRRFRLGLVSDNAWDIHNRVFEFGVVYKTHALGNELKAFDKPKVIFLFGKASDAAISVMSCKKKYGDHWVKLHFEHLRASGDFDEIYNRDVLRFGDQLDSWIGLSGVERLVLNYDSIWDHQDIVSGFLGIDVDFPIRRERSSLDHVSQADIERLRMCYEDLDSKIARIPSCKLLR